MCLANDRRHEHQGDHTMSSIDNHVRIYVQDTIFYFVVQTITP